LRHRAACGAKNLESIILTACRHHSAYLYPARIRASDEGGAWKIIGLFIGARPLPALFRRIAGIRPVKAD